MQRREQCSKQHCKNAACPLHSTRVVQIALEPSTKCKSAPTYLYFIPCGSTRTHWKEVRALLVAVPFENVLLQSRTAEQRKLLHDTPRAASTIGLSSPKPSAAAELGFSAPCYHLVHSTRAQSAEQPQRTAACSQHGDCAHRQRRWRNTVPTALLHRRWMEAPGYPQSSARPRAQPDDSVPRSLNPAAPPRSKRH